MSKAFKFTARVWLVLCLVFFFPIMAQAHSAGTHVNGLQDGFNHPLHGWDHLLAMFAVGLWAARQHGRMVWLMPLTFVGVMSIGGLAGAVGVALPGAEMMILLSVIVFGGLVFRRKQFRPRVSLLVVVFFAFFHGLAHGQEMPASASLTSFACGFVV